MAISEVSDLGFWGGIVSIQKGLTVNIASDRLLRISSAALGLKAKSTTRIALIITRTAATAADNNTNSSTEYVIANLSYSTHPQTALDLYFVGNETVTFKIQSIESQSTAAEIHLTGYSTVYHEQDIHDEGEDESDEFDDEDDEEDPEGIEYAFDEDESELESESGDQEYPTIIQELAAAAAGEDEDDDDSDELEQPASTEEVRQAMKHRIREVGDSESESDSEEQQQQRQQQQQQSTNGQKKRKPEPIVKSPQQKPATKETQQPQSQQKKQKTAPNTPAAATATATPGKTPKSAKTGAFKCPHGGCDRSFNSEDALKQHNAGKHQK